jgi:hypothetical protein
MSTVGMDWADNSCALNNGTLKTPIKRLTNNAMQLPHLKMLSLYFNY